MCRPTELDHLTNIYSEPHEVRHLLDIRVQLYCSLPGCFMCIQFHLFFSLGLGQKNTAKSVLFTLLFLRLHAGLPDSPSSVVRLLHQEEQSTIESTFTTVIRKWPFSPGCFMSGCFSSPRPQALSLRLSARGHLFYLHLSSFFLFNPTTKVCVSGRTGHLLFWKHILWFLTSLPLVNYVIFLSGLPCLWVH